MKTYETRAQYLEDCTERKVNSYRPPAAPYFVRCEDCGKVCPHSESVAHSETGFVCYGCAHARDLAELRDTSRPFCCYVSNDAKRVTNWPGYLIGEVFAYAEHRTGWHGSTQARFRVRDVHGNWWSGRGAGRGMYCTLRPMKTPA